MLHATKPPATTYARRKSRAKQQERCEITNNQSSPLEELPPDAQDLTISEMSRRMKKRSRLVLSASHESTERSFAEPVLKKSKSAGSERSGSVCKSHSTSPASPSKLGLLSLGTEQLDDAVFFTPDLPMKKLTMPGEVEPSTTQDPLSPIPVARRMLSRTSSRNLKENSRRNLASPFHSRPGSRPSSPFHATRQTGRVAAHTKTRTLSTDLKKKKHSVIAEKTGAFGHSSIADTSCNTSAPTSVSHTTHHARTASIPAITASVLDGIAPEDWLVPPKALSRSPSVALLEDLELDTFQAEHPSFYFDAPAKASTPPRKRSATVTQASYKTQQRAPAGTVPTEPRAAANSERMVLDEDDIGERQPRRRRRTVIHMSSDSIFSSALDFSTYQTGGSFAKQHNAASNAAASPAGSVSAAFVASAGIATTLDPAFSPFPTPATDLLMEDATSASAIQTHPPSIALSDTSIHPPFPLRRSYSQPVPAPLLPTLQNLQAAFNELKLNTEPPKSGYSSPKAYVVAPSQEPTAGTIRNDNAAVDPGHDKTHGRRRGDTIRASDFAPPLQTSLLPSPAFPPEDLDVDIDNSPPDIEPEIAFAAPVPKRTRSGTVTQLNAILQAPTQEDDVMAVSAGSRPPVKPKPRTRAGKKSTRTDPTIAQATMIMKIDDNPLTPQASDEEDDPLLLTGQVWVDPSGNSFCESNVARRIVHC